MTEYDVFLSHNSADKSAVETLARRLADEAGLQPFLDKWHLIPGEPWQEAIEAALDQSRTCTVFIGPRGIGLWEHEEMRAAIERRVADRALRVVPVLLPGAERGERGRLPAFLSRATWVEFRESLDDKDAFHCLVAGIKGIPPGRGPGEVVYTGVCPYRGLQVFEEEHARFFFGREADTEWLVDDLRPSTRLGTDPSTGSAGKANRFLAVVGSSGSGKSSLVRAGLVPALRRGDLPGSDNWPLYVFRPGHRPLESLAVSLAQVTGQAGDLTVLPRLIDSLAADQRQLHLAVRLALADAPPAQAIALVVDQFEEVFTLCQDERQREAFINNLLYASAVDGGRVVVVLTIRSDFYGKCATHPDLAARITDHQMLVSPMEEEQLHQAIVRPAELVGMEFEGGVVETLLRDVGTEPGTLPLLEHTLLELWERREGNRLTFAAYREIGGVHGAIAHRAETVYSDLDAMQQATARRILLRLTQPGEGTEDTRRRAALTELLPAEGDTTEVEAVVQELADARLLTTSKDERDNEIVDVAHEALIQGWPRLRRWIEEDRAALRTHRRLTEEAEEWERNKRDKSYLYYGARLAEAEEWAGAHIGDLNPMERHFLEASLAFRERERARAERQQRIVTLTKRMGDLAQSLNVDELIAHVRRLVEDVFGYHANIRLAENGLKVPASVVSDGTNCSGIVIPLEVQDHVIGMLEVHSNLPDVFGEDELLAFQSLATQTATAIAYAQSFEHVSRLGQELEQKVQERTEVLARTLEDLTDARDRVDALYRITSELPASLDLDRVLGEALSLINRTVGVSHGSVMLVNPGDGSLIYRAALGRSKSLPRGGLPTRFRLGVGLAGWVLEHRAPVIVPDVTKDPRWIPDEQDITPERKSAIAVPLNAHEDVLGVLLLFHPEVDYFTADHLQLVSAAAAQVAAAVNNAELYRLLTEQAERLGVMLRTQRIETVKLQAILEGISDGVLVFDARLNVILINPVAARMLGLDASDIDGYHLGKILGQAESTVDQAVAQQLHDKLIAVTEHLRSLGSGSQGEMSSLDFRLEVDRKVILVRLSPVWERYLGELSNVVATLRDISREMRPEHLTEE